ncbi:hypothetical protein GYA49_05845 [Candidatus Beckwithbacteria bacterium]|nr:hypothetical protein [Candidatus Beckwithbacteria bacterium]
MLEVLNPDKSQSFSFRPSIDNLLSIYREKKGGPTNRCVDCNGLSCSQRWERSFEKHKKEGEFSLIALIKAINGTVDDCSKRNGISQAEALKVFVTGMIKTFMADEEERQEFEASTAQFSGLNPIELKNKFSEICRERKYTFGQALAFAGFIAFSASSGDVGCGGYSLSIDTGTGNYSEHNGC